MSALRTRQAYDILVDDLKQLCAQYEKEVSKHNNFRNFLRHLRRKSEKYLYLTQFAVILQLIIYISAFPIDEIVNLGAKIPYLSFNLGIFALNFYLDYRDFRHRYHNFAFCKLRSIIADIQTFAQHLDTTNQEGVRDVSSTSQYPDLYHTYAPSMNFQWTFRRRNDEFAETDSANSHLKSLCNLPVPLLVRGDLIYLRPGQRVFVRCEYEEEMHHHQLDNKTSEQPNKQKLGYGDWFCPKLTPRGKHEHETTTLLHHTDNDDDFAMTLQQKARPKHHHRQKKRFQEMPSSVRAIVLETPICHFIRKYLETFCSSSSFSALSSTASSDCSPSPSHFLANSIPNLYLKYGVHTISALIFGLMLLNWIVFAAFRISFRKSVSKTASSPAAYSLHSSNFLLVPLPLLLPLCYRFILAVSSSRILHCNALLSPLLLFFNDATRGSGFGRTIWRHFINPDLLVQQLLLNLGCVTSICCPDKKGILSHPIVAVEKLYFFSKPSPPNTATADNADNNDGQQLVSKDELVDDKVANERKEATEKVIDNSQQEDQKKEKPQLKTLEKRGSNSASTTNIIIKNTKFRNRIRIGTANKNLLLGWKSKAMASEEQQQQRHCSSSSFITESALEHSQQQQQRQQQKQPLLSLWPKKSHSKTSPSLQQKKKTLQNEGNLATPSESIIGKSNRSTSLITGRAIGCANTNPQIARDPVSSPSFAQGGALANFFLPNTTQECFLLSNQEHQHLLTSAISLAEHQTTTMTETTELNQVIRKFSHPTPENVCKTANQKASNKIQELLKKDPTNKGTTNQNELIILDLIVEKNNSNVKNQSKFSNVNEEQQTAMASDLIKTTNSNLKNTKEKNRMQNFFCVAEKPKRINFEDTNWRRHLSSLKPIGLNILLTNCNLHSLPHFVEFTDFLNLVAEKKLNSFDRISGINHRCMCALSQRIGFQGDVLCQYALRRVIKCYQASHPFTVPPNSAVISNINENSENTSQDQARKMEKSRQMRDLKPEMQNQKLSTDGNIASSRNKINLQYPISNVYSVVMQHHPRTCPAAPSQSVLMSQGTGDLLIGMCSAYWNGSDVVPMRPQDRQRILAFYRRNLHAAYSTVFAYRPLPPRSSPSSSLTGEEEDILIELKKACPASTFTGAGNAAGNPDGARTEGDASRRKPPRDTEEAMLSRQIFLGMTSQQYPVDTDLVEAIGELERCCIRFIYFSRENQLRSRVFAERLGIESGWNCHISLAQPPASAASQCVAPSSAKLSTASSLSNSSSSSDSSSSTRNSSSSTSLEMLESDPFFISEKVMKENKSKLPRGIENIRPHLKHVDNVPLLVSLFTDCDTDSIREMMRIMQEHDEVVCLVGSSLALSNMSLFSAANCSVAMTPILCSPCKNRRRHHPSELASPPPSSSSSATNPPPHQQPIKSGEVGVHSSEHGNDPPIRLDPITLASRLIALPSALMQTRRDGFNIMLLIRECNQMVKHLLLAMGFFFVSSFATHLFISAFTLLLDFVWLYRLQIWEASMTQFNASYFSQSPFHPDIEDDDGGGWEANAYVTFNPLRLIVFSALVQPLLALVIAHRHAGISCSSNSRASPPPTRSHPARSNFSDAFNSSARDCTLREQQQDFSKGDVIIAAAATTAAASVGGDDSEAATQSAHPLLRPLASHSANLPPPARKRNKLLTAKNILRFVVSNCVRFLPAISLCLAFFAANAFVVLHIERQQERQERANSSSSGQSHFSNSSSPAIYHYPVAANQQRQRIRDAIFVVMSLAGWQFSCYLILLAYFYSHEEHRAAICTLKLNLLGRRLRNLRRLRSANFTNCSLTFLFVLVSLDALCSILPPIVADLHRPALSRALSVSPARLYLGLQVLINLLLIGLSAPLIIAFCIYANKWEKRKLTAEHRLAKLYFGTKLGMYSPV